MAIEWQVKTPMTEKQIKELLKKNPNVNPQQLGEAIDLLNALGAGGVPDSQYDIVSPFDRRFGVERKAAHTKSFKMDRSSG